MTTRALIPIAIACLAAACCGRSSPTPETPMTTTSPTASPACRASLEALTDGKWDAWDGGAACRKADVAAVLGAPLATGPVFAGLERHAPRALAANGVLVGYRDDRLAVVKLPTPDLTAAGLAALGEPEARDPSGAGPLSRQWIWAARGLTAHVSEADGLVTMLTAYAPMTLDAYRATGLGHESVARDPGR